MIKAVLFDWNGVIFDDLDAVARASCDCIFKLTGNKLSVEKWFKEIKQDWYIIYRNYGVKQEDIEKVITLMKEYYPRYKKYVKLTNNVVEVLNELKLKKIEVGILSGMHRKIINDNIEMFNLKDSFSFVIGQGDVKNHKPHPEGLLKAINKFNLNPNEILYVDDMPVNFPEAKKLGLNTVGFESRVSDDLSGADFCVKDFRDIIKIIKTLDKKAI